MRACPKSPTKQCVPDNGCHCYSGALEPNDTCPLHGSYLGRMACVYCSKFMSDADLGKRRVISSMCECGHPLANHLTTGTRQCKECDCKCFEWDGKSAVEVEYKR